MFISESTINEIKNRLSLSDVVSLYLPLVRKGSDNWVVCPFHNDKNPSMKLDDEKGLYYCFGCKASGNMFTFVMKMDNLDFVEAVKKLAEIAHVEIEEDKKANPKRKNDKDVLYNLYEILNNEFRTLLWSGSTDGAKKALDYVKKRGYTDEIINEFGVGYAPDDWDFVKRIASKVGVEYSLLQNSGLLSKKDNSYFVDRITFPIYNRSLKVVAFSARTMKTDDSTAKYINSSESPIFSKKLEFFGFNAAQSSLKNGEIPVLCEGNFDVMALHQADVRSALATCGTALSKEQCAVLRRYNERVRTFFDADEAGQIATIKSLPLLKAQGLSPSVVVMKREDAKDASEFLQKFGKDALQKLVNSSVNGFQYAIKSLSRNADITTVKGKNEVFEKLLPLIYSVENIVERDELFRKVCSTLALDEHSARSEYEKNRKALKQSEERQEKRVEFSQKTEENTSLPKSIWTQYNDAPDYETHLMKELAYSRELFEYLPLLKQIDYKSFTNPKAAAIYSFLREKADLNPNEDDEAFLLSIEDPEMKEYLENARREALDFKTWPLEKKQKAIENAINRMTTRSYEKDMNFYNNAISVGIDTTCREGTSFLDRMGNRKQEFDEIKKYDKFSKRGNL